MTNCLPLKEQLPASKNMGLFNQTFVLTLLFTITCSLFTSLLPAQQRTITGKVTSGTDNTPLAGASVEVKALPQVQQQIKAATFR